MTVQFKCIVLAVINYFYCINACGQISSTNQPGLSAKPVVIFRPNNGQVYDGSNQLRSDVLFSGFAGTMEFHFTRTGMQYQVNSGNKTHRVEIEWLNASCNSVIETGEQLPGMEHFYFGGREPVLNVPSYKSIRYKNIYPGIDLLWYYGANGLEYDFLLQPGADANRIRMRVSGVKASLTKRRELILKTDLGIITEGKLQVYQGEKRINARWKLKGNIASFDITGNYNAKLPLRIDPPVRQWSTYYGGTARDQAQSCTAKGTDAVYVAGWTQSSSGIATTGAHQSSRPGGRDGFLVKFNAAGQRQWATYFGGVLDEEIYSCCEDSNGDLFIAGKTNGSPGLATAGAHKTTTAGGDAILAKFNSSGIRQWSTYYGGNGADQGQYCSVDNNGNVYLAGNTNSATDIATAGAFQPALTNAVNTDAFLAKFSSTGGRRWGTYYGGAGSELTYGCMAERSGDILLAGTTSSTDGIASANGHQQIFGGATYDGFVVSFDTLGNRLWGTYYGGSENDYVYACTQDGAGNVFITGTTYSAAGIATPGSHQAVKTGSNLETDAFLAKFSQTGTREWATYYGGTGGENGYACATDTDNSIYMAGGTTSETGIATAGAHQTLKAGTNLSSDGFICKFSSNGQRQWGTYFGDVSDDWANGCTAASGGKVYITGLTNSSGSTLASAGAHQGNYAGGTYDAFIAQFDGGAAASTGFIFTGSGNWSNAANWQGGVTPPAVIPAGTTVQINPASGECIIDLPVTFSPGSILTVLDGKQLLINGNLVIQ